MIKIAKILLLPFCFITASIKLSASDYPSTTLKSKGLEVLVFLPDSAMSYYQAARFDWGSMVGQITYKNHTYLQQWENYNGRGPADKHDPLVPNTGTGLAEEFLAALGYDEAPVNGFFVKIGVGILQKHDTAKYSFAIPYKVVNQGKRTFSQTKNSLTFTHSLNSDIGYGYKLERTYQLKDNQLIVHHELTNTGKKRIVSEMISHNFMQFDYGAFGTDFSLQFLKSTIDNSNQKWASPNRVKFNESSIDIVTDMNDYTPCFGGINVHSKNGNCRLINKKTGMAVTIEPDKEVSSFVAWMWQKAFCAEPRILVDVEPGKAFSWDFVYGFELPQAPKEDVD